MSVGSSLEIGRLDNHGDPIEDTVFLGYRWAQEPTLHERVLLSSDSFMSEIEGEHVEVEGGGIIPGGYTFYYGGDFKRGNERLIWLWKALKVHPQYKDLFQEKIFPEIQQFVTQISLRLRIEETEQLQLNPTPKFDRFIQDLALVARESMRLPKAKQEAVLSRHSIPDEEKEDLLTLYRRNKEHRTGKSFLESSFEDCIEYLQNVSLPDSSVWLVSAGDILSDDIDDERLLTKAYEEGEIVEKYRDQPEQMLKELYFCGRDTSIMGHVWDIPEHERVIHESDLTHFYAEFE